MPAGETAVIGLGRSGSAVTRLLRREGRSVYASDRGTGPELEATASQLRSLGAAVDLGGHDIERIARAASCVVSPGVPPDAPPLRAARTAGVPVRAEADVGLEAVGGVPFIAITGTNGKTTTTALACHLMVRDGWNAITAGNIGTPLSEVALGSTMPGAMAVELSSFQLHDMFSLRPNVGVLTNLSPDHLDRYSSVEEYYTDKARLFQHAGPHSVWISNADDPASREMVLGVPGIHHRFSTRLRADAWYDRDQDRLMLHGEVLLPRAELPLLGDHNVANALAAALAVKQLMGADLEDLADGLRTFRALAHRVQPVREVGGVLWINDSKATNLASTEVALAAMTRPFVLLLGGRHKGEPYTRLGPLLGRARGVVAYGEAGPIVMGDLAGSGVPLVSAGSFEEVMAAARDLARPGDAVLLSPACSSYDMFDNYEHRGRRFREIVEAW